MTLVQLEYYIGACECGNITKAARRLNITQPALSAAIKQLENEYGSVFFMRSSCGKNVVTEGGRFFYEFAKSALSEINETERRVRAACSKTGN